MKVLIIEDDIKLANTYKTILNDLFDVTILQKLSSAIEIIKKQDFDVVLLDIMLPDGFGYDLIPYIKKQSSALVIIISALEENETKRLAYEKGADDYMLKPITLFELEYKLRAINKRQNTSKSIYKIGDVTLDIEKLTLSTDYNSVPIQYSQGMVLKLLYEKHLQKDILYKHELSDFKEINKIDDFRIHTLISRLRKSIQEIDSDKIIIENVYGKGYRLVVIK